MSIYTARFRETVTPLRRSCLNVPKSVFKSRLKRSYSMAGSRNESGSVFRTVDQRLKKSGCRKCCDETAEYSVCDNWKNGDAGGQELQKLARSSGRGTVELGTKDTDEQTRQTCAAPAVESSWYTIRQFYTLLLLHDIKCCGLASSRLTALWRFINFVLLLLLLLLRARTSNDLMNVHNSMRILSPRLSNFTRRITRNNRKKLMFTTLSSCANIGAIIVYFKFCRP